MTSTADTAAKPIPPGDRPRFRTFGEFLVDDAAEMSDEDLMRRFQGDDAEIAFLTARQAITANELQVRRTPLPSRSGTNRSPSLGRWIAATTRRPTDAAGRIVADGRRLDALPAVLELLATTPAGASVTATIANGATTPSSNSFGPAPPRSTRPAFSSSTWRSITTPSSARPTRGSTTSRAKAMVGRG